MSIDNIYLNALPPFAQELREKEAIANDPKVQEYLDSINEKIVTIFKNIQNQYTVQTSNHTIQVNVIYTHDEKLCQPKNFILEVLAPQSLNRENRNLHSGCLYESKEKYRNLE